MPERLAMDAINTPIRRAREETNTADLPIGQKADIYLKDDQPIDREQIIVMQEGSVNKSYLEDLAFNEDPVTILIHPSREKNAAPVVDCWVNGRGAEVFTNGRWYSLAWLPINIECVVKRKYVEVLARASIDTIDTDVDDTTVKDPENRIVRVTSALCTFSVLHDPNPKGREWLRRVMAQPR